MARRNINEIAAPRATPLSPVFQERRHICFAGFTIDLSRLSLLRDDKPLYLRRQSFDVLRYLVEHPGRLIGKDELIEKVWPHALVTDDSLVQCVKDIRAATADTAHRIIRTVPRRGYMFLPEVTGGAAQDVPAPPMSRVRYAKSGDIHIAFQAWGEGPVDLIFAPGFVTHVESLWSEPGMARFLRAMGRFARVVMFDKRGTGMSDRVDKMPGMDQRVDDVRAVMDAVKIKRAVIMGASEGGSLAAYFAATHPQRCQALVLYGAFAHFAAWIPDDEAFRHLIEYIDSSWGSGRSLPSFAPSMVGNAAFEKWWGRFERLGATPADAISLMHTNSQIDITDVLSTIHVPTLVIHRTNDVAVNVEGGRLMAARIPDARFIELPGVDHLPWVGDNSDKILRLIGEFVSSSMSAPVPDRVLATVLVLDMIAPSNALVRVLTPAQQDIVSHHLERFRGRQFRTIAHGMLALFDGPSRAIDSALAIQHALQQVGIAVRLSIHVGEVEQIGQDVLGLAVDVAVGAVKHANVGEIVVSKTVKDLVAGANVSFEYIGTHASQGGDAWPLYRAAASPQGP